MTGTLPQFPQLGTPFESAAKSKPRKPKRPTPVSLRLTLDERARLEREADGRSLSDHIRERLFNGDAAPRKIRGLKPVKDRQALARVLSALGRSGLAEDFGTLAWALEDGQLCLSAESEHALRRACGQINAMRRDLVAALGLRPE